MKTDDQTVSLVIWCLAPHLAAGFTTGELAVLRVRDNKTERVEVTLGRRDAQTERVEVQQGLAEGDLLLVGAAQGMTPGTPVRIRQAPAAGGDD